MALALLLLDHFHRDTISLFSSKSPTQSCWLFLVFGEEIWIIGSGLILRCFGQKFVGKIFVCLKRQILWWSSLVPHPPERVSFTKGSCITSFEGSSFYESLHFEKPWIQKDACHLPVLCVRVSLLFPAELPPEPLSTRPFICGLANGIDDLKSPIKYSLVEGGKFSQNHRFR